MAANTIMYHCSALFWARKKCFTVSHYYFVCLSDIIWSCLISAIISAFSMYELWITKISLAFIGKPVIYISKLEIPKDRVYFSFTEFWLQNLGRSGRQEGSFTRGVCPSLAKVILECSLSFFFCAESVLCFATCLSKTRLGFSRT